MDFQLLKASHASDKARWLSIWEALPDSVRDVYFHPGYLLASESDGRGEAWCALASDGDALFLYPFLKLPIKSRGTELVDGNIFDIQTAYGYGGPVVNKAGQNADFLKDVWRDFSRFCAKASIIAEFSRLHPLIDTHKWVSKNTQVVNDRITVHLCLDSYEHNLWHDSYYRVHRNMLRRAEREGCTFRAADIKDQMSWFANIYATTHQKLNGSIETDFTEKYFQALEEELADRAWLGLVEKDGIILVALIVIEGAELGHSFLMAYTDNGGAKGATNLLYHGAAIEAKRRGLSVLNMGGGVSKELDDKLLRFKQSLGEGRGCFRIGTTCHNQEVYETLEENWEKHNGQRPSGYFQFYRLSD